MPPKNGLDFKAARRPYFSADEVSYGRFVLAHYISTVNMVSFGRLFG